MERELPVDGLLSLLADCLRYSTRSSSLGRPLSSAGNALYVMHTSRKKRATGWIGISFAQVHRVIYLSCPTQRQICQRSGSRETIQRLTFHKGNVLHTTCHPPKNLSSLNLSADNSGALESGSKIWTCVTAIVSPETAAVSTKMSSSIVYRTRWDPHLPLDADDSPDLETFCDLGR